ncbi:hypothetical protein ABZW10_17915 [Kitasatospora sp. NPDC004723]|uniref:hypothetical protein n=1 Tax=Kitasatospora sp. NPDC004723 TaxID=3154288 RepID=UPI0033A9A27F
MQAIEQRLSTWARQATPAERRAGPTVADLGGLDEVTAAADELATGPLLPFLASAAAHLLEHADTGAGTNAALPLCAAVLTGLREQDSHAAFTGALDVLTTRPALSRGLGQPLVRVLLARLTAAEEAGDDVATALIGAEAADCLVQLTLAGITSAARLLGAMDAITEDAAALPEAFAARLPRLLGVLEGQHPGAGLREALERCLMLDHTCRDAAFELALADLREALQQDQYATMAAQLAATQQRLAEVIATDPDRLDAQLYHSAIDAVLGLSAPDAPTRVPAAAATLRSTLQRYRSWRWHTTTPAWAQPRQRDITAWIELTLRLDTAAPHMGSDNPWYERGQGILTALLSAYTAHSTVAVLTGAPAAAVIETLVAPVIEDTFLQRENRIDTLRYALTHDDELRQDPAAQELYAALLQRAAAPDGAVGTTTAGDPGKARRWHRLAATIPQEFAALVESIDEGALDAMELALRAREDVVAPITDAKYSRLMRDLTSQLAKSSDWLPDIADPFALLLDATVRYAYICYDIGRKMGGSYTEYLRLRDKDGKKQKVDEALFHQHYREVLTFSALFGIVNSEVIDRGGGRADILVSFPATRFNVECKIEEDDATETGLRKYVAQAAEYQNTSAAFAILLVLDKTVGAEGAVNLFNSIWIEPVQRQGEIEPCYVAIVRVPGGRDNPNLLRAAP